MPRFVASGLATAAAATAMVRLAAVSALAALVEAVVSVAVSADFALTVSCFVTGTPRRHEFPSPRVDRASDKSFGVHVVIRWTAQPSGTHSKGY